MPFEIKEAGAKVERCSQRGIGTNLRIWKLHRSLIFFSFKGQRFDVVILCPSRWQMGGNFTIVDGEDSVATVDVKQCLKCPQGIQITTTIRLGPALLGC